METVLQYLHAIHPLSPALQEYLAAVLQVKELAKKDFFLKAGHVCQRIGFVRQGLLRCYSLYQDTEICSGFLKEGDLVLSPASFFKQEVSKESIQAIEACEIHTISYPELQYIYASFPEFHVISRLLTQQYLLQDEQLLHVLRVYRSHERYQFLLQHYPELVQRVPSKYIASYLGVTDVTLSNVKHKVIS